MPARPSKVVDVTGAGDAVLAALAVCLGGGLLMAEALTVAMAAAGLKCERRGAVPVPLAEVVADLRRLEGRTPGPDHGGPVSASAS